MYSVAIDCIGWLPGRLPGDQEGLFILLYLSQHQASVCFLVWSGVQLCASSTKRIKHLCNIHCHV